jgi:hypothetical protein
MNSTTFNALNEEKRMLIKMQSFETLCSECNEKIQERLNAVQDEIEEACEMLVVTND